MVGRQSVELTADREGVRLDKLLAERLGGLSRAKVQRMIEGGLVTVNRRTVKSNYRTRPGDLILVQAIEEEPGGPEPEAIPLDIVFEDDDLLVVNKPAGMVVHPAFGHQHGTLVNALLDYLPALEDGEQPDRPGIVHRLDMGTSGLIVVAKSGLIRGRLQAQFKGREVRKTYLALVEGRLTAAHGIVDAALGRDPRRRKRIAVVAEGRPSVTEYHVLERFEHQTYVEAVPHTGRTHQIRVHMAYIGHPVVGDKVYGYRKQRLPLERLFLHAARLVFRHPRTGEPVDLSVPLPDDLQRALETLRKERRP